MNLKKTPKISKNINLQKNQKCRKIQENKKAKIKTFKKISKKYQKI